MTVGAEHKKSTIFALFAMPDLLNDYCTGAYLQFIYLWLISKDCVF
jgi:hypothetical protein